MNPLDTFVKSILKEHRENIISILQFGSKKKSKESDIDLFILLKKRDDIQKIIKTIRESENLIHLSHTPFTYFLESHFLVSNEYTGIHSILIGKDELTEEFKPKSIRLKILTNFLISNTIFLHNLKKQYQILYGRDVIKNIKIPLMKKRDKYLCFPLSYLILCCALFTFPNKNTFKIWCFKATKYYVENMRVYTGTKDLPLDLKMYSVAQKYRYNPEQYRGSRLLLYMLSWKSLIKNCFIVLYRKG